MTKIRDSGVSLGFTKFTQFIKTYAILQTLVGIVFLPSFLTAPPFIVPVLFTCVTVAVLLSWYFSGPTDKDTSPPPKQPQWLRKFPIFKFYRNYFPISLTKAMPQKALDQRRNYIFVYHPESLVSYGAYCNFLTETTNFSLKFPGIRPYILTITFNFYWAVARRIILWLGFCDAAQKNVEWLLSDQHHSSKSEERGIAAVVIVPGQEKTIQTEEERLRMERRLLKAFTKAGFVRVALRMGVPLVPCFSFGESRVSPHIAITRRVWIVKEALKFLRSLFPLLKFVFYALYLPNRRAIDTVVGPPLELPHIPEPTKEHVDYYNRKYLEAVSLLFEQHKYVHNVAPDGHFGLK